MKYEEEDLKETAQSIDDGSYFKDALSWYMVKFCSPISERIFWGVVLLFCAIFIFYLQNQLRSWYPLKTQRPIIIYNKDVTLKQVVTKMQNPYNNPDYALVRYLIKNYVEMREEFRKGSLDILKIDDRLKHIANNSTREITKDYQKIFYLEDIRNPIKKLGAIGSRKIEIIDIKLNIRKLSVFEKAKTFNKLIKLPTAATVTYRAREDVANNQTTSLWEAKIGFQYGGVIIDEVNKDLTFGGFTVTDYTQRKLR